MGEKAKKIVPLILFILLMVVLYDTGEPFSVIHVGRQDSLKESPTWRAEPPVPAVPGFTNEDGNDSSRAANASRVISEAIYWDFDDDDGNFTSGAGSSWMWGVPSSPPLAGANKAWETGGQSPYPDLDCSILDSPTITITSSSCFLFYKQHLEIEDAADGGNVQISIDGGDTFEVIHPIRGYPYPPPLDVECLEGLDGPVFSGFSDGYESAVFYLGDYVGTNAIIRWVFESDVGGNFQGWIVDDVRVFGAHVF